MGYRGGFGVLCDWHHYWFQHQGFDFRHYLNRHPRLECGRQVDVTTQGQLFINCSIAQGSRLMIVDDVFGRCLQFYLHHQWA